MSLEALWVRYVSIISLVFIVVGLYFAWGLPLDMVLTSTTLLLIIFMVIAITFNISPLLSSMDKSLKEIRRTLEDKPHQSNPGSGEKEEIKTSGSGAFAGMAIGGLIGLAGGPVGVIIGGLLGAIFGDALESEGIRKERKTR